MGLTVFWGYCGLPIPYVPPHGVSMCIADPIPVTKYCPPPLPAASTSTASAG